MTVDRLDKVASELEALGMIKEAAEVDSITNSLSSGNRVLRIQTFRDGGSTTITTNFGDFTLLNRMHGSKDCVVGGLDSEELIDRKTAEKLIACLSESKGGFLGAGRVPFCLERLNSWKSER